MKKILLAGFLALSSITARVEGQSCFNVSAGNDTTISCMRNCLDLHARIPDLRSTETYQVVSIPYTPYAYTTPFGTTDPLVNADDHFSDSFSLPFTFCFYGNTYSKIAVGSNGVITFDVTANANTREAYFIEPGDIIPYSGGIPDTPDIYYAPRASIFLAYVDLNPITSPPGNKIEWRVEGTAPCRRFVVSYYNEGNYNNLNCLELTTMQAVLYEGSGIIDVFYENKPACPVYQSGLSIAGVQNWNQDQAVTPPGRNGTVWTARNEGIRYVPGGSSSLLNRVELYKNNVLISTGSITTLGNGELDAVFPNICQSEDSMSYVIKAFYKQCDNPAVETEGSGMIKVLLIDTMRLELGPDSTICYGSSLVLRPQTNDLTDTFRWRPRAGLNYDTVKNPIATPNDTTKYILLAKWGICQREDSVTINILHKPVALAGNDTTICTNSFAILNGSAANLSGPVTYAWTPAASVIPPNLPIAVAHPDSTQQYVLTVKDSYGCNFTVTDSMWVFMEPPVPAFAGNDTNALLDKPHHLKATGGVSYSWTPAGPLNDPNIADPIAILHNDTYFRVWVTDAIGCKAFSDVFIKVYDGPAYYLPNAFTPNGDGLNDKFYPVPVGIKSTDYFMVYNRFGELVFQTRIWMQGWDGTFKGKPANQDSYVWIIRGHDENGSLMELKGTVMLIR